MANVGAVDEGGGGVGGVVDVFFLVVQGRDAVVGQAASRIDEVGHQCVDISC